MLLEIEKLCITQVDSTDDCIRLYILYTKQVYRTTGFLYSKINIL